MNADPPPPPADPDPPARGVAPDFRESNFGSLHVRAEVATVAGLLAELHPVADWVPEAAGQPVTVKGQAFVVYRPAGTAWSVVVDRKGLIPAPKLTRALATRTGGRAVAVAASDTGGYFRYDLWDNGRRLELYEESDGEFRFESVARPDAPPEGGPDEVFDALLRAEGSYEPCWTFTDFFAAATEPDGRWRLAPLTDEVERVDFVGVAAQRRRAGR